MSYLTLRQFVFAALITLICAVLMSPTSIYAGAPSSASVTIGVEGSGGNSGNPFIVIDKIESFESLKPCTLVTDSQSFSKVYLEETKKITKGELRGKLSSRT